MAYVRNALDERVLVWTKQVGGATSDKAIISAHGESAIINGSFPQGEYTLLYYAPHGYKLKDPGLRSVLDSIAWPMQRISADELPKSALERFKSTNPAQDYNLTKYQGKGSKNAETYKQIEDLPDSCPMDIITVRGEKNAPWWFKALGNL